MRTVFNLWLLMTASLGMMTAMPAIAQEPVEGYAIYTHDPSTLIKEGNRYYYFMTSQDLVYHWSTDLRNWNNHATVFPSGPPAWTTDAVPAFTGYFWAPDVAYFNGKYHVYYSVSDWGTIDSAIGVVSSPSLVSPTWTDHGKVVQSDPAGYEQPETDTTAFNCIDPSILVETDGTNETVWMTFSSYSSGILITEIDPSTGLLLDPSSVEDHLVANNSGHRGWGSSIEGAFTYKHNGYYYLFVNYGGCCSGVDSTYNIRVGRSTNITGPYFDKDGVDMRDAGGTMLLESSGRFVGPGHPGILKDGDTEWFSYHYYEGIDDGTHLGWSKYSLLRLSWDADDWPVLSDDWSAFYPFSVGGREHMDLYDGSLQSGAVIVSDAELDSNVLELNGTGYVALPDAVANCSTVAAWVKWNGGGDWQRIFDFGSGTTNYMFMTPRAYLAGMRFAITTGGPGGEQVIDAPFTLPTDTWCHVAVTLDGEQGVIYFNGEAVASNSVSIRPWEIQARNNYVGKSQWPDPGFDGRIASFRVFAHALTPAEVKEIAHAHPALAHRYSFAEDAGDSIGMAHGQLKGNATISAEKLSLPGSSGSYANLPGGLVSGSRKASIEFWADINPNTYWARIFDFGNMVGGGGTSDLFLTPRMSSTQYRMEVNGLVLDVPGNLNQQSVHVVCIVDPPSNYSAIYVNGVLAKEQTGSISSLESIGKGWAFLGRSLYAADPYLNADIDEFRIYDGRLTPQEITNHFAAGPDTMYVPTAYNWTNDSVNVTFEWPGYPAGYGLEYATALSSNTSWIPVAPPMPSGGGYSQTLSIDSISNSNAYFRLSR